MPIFESATSAIDVTVRSTWKTGLSAAMAFTPQLTQTGWTVAFEYDGDINRIWNAKIVSRVGNLYVVENLQYNDDIEPGETVTFGFRGRGTSTDITPVDLNGETVGDTGDTTTPPDNGDGTDDGVVVDNGDGGSMPMDLDDLDNGSGGGSGGQTPPGEGDDQGDHDHGAGHGDGHDHGGHGDMGGSSGNYVDITTYGSFHGSSSHTGHDELTGGRTAITTEALEAYNMLRAFFGLDAATLEEVGAWAFSNNMTNNTQAWGGDLQGVGLYYAMQGAKVGWIRDEAFDPQILADIQREARLGDPDKVMEMVEAYGHTGFADYLTDNDLVDTFISTLKMEPHYGGWMHGRVHGWMTFPDGDGARAHDVNHLTVLSHDQTRPFMNDTFDWPQWSALDVPHADVIDYFQSMVVLGDPLGDALPSDGSGTPVVPVEPTPIVPDPVDPGSSDPGDDGSDLDARLIVTNDWGSGATLDIEIINDTAFEFTGGWDVTFELDPTIDQYWNGTFSQTGNVVSVESLDWNGYIAAGDSVRVGFRVDEGNLDVDALNASADFFFN